MSEEEFEWQKACEAENNFQKAVEMALMSRIARSCEIYKFYDFSQFLQDNDFSAVCCEIYEFLHFFVMLINSQPQSQLADFTKFA